MQHARPPDSYTTGGTRDSRCLFEREFALLHFKRLRLQPVANLFNYGQCLPLVASMPISYLSVTSFSGRGRSMAAANMKPMPSRVRRSFCFWSSLHPYDKRQSIAVIIRSDLPTTHSRKINPGHDEGMFFISLPSSIGLVVNP